MTSYKNLDWLISALGLFHMALIYERMNDTKCDQVLAFLIEKTKFLCK